MRYGGAANSNRLDQIENWNNNDDIDSNENEADDEGIMLTNKSIVYKLI